MSSKLFGDLNPSRRPEVRAKLRIAAAKPENKTKLIENITGDKNPAKRPEVREKISLKAKGRKLSPEAKIKIGESNKGRQTRLGAILSTETKARISNSLKGKYLKDKSFNWKGGISLNSREYSNFQKRQRRLRLTGASGSHTLGEWETLKVQYGFTCPCCGKSEPEIKLTEDHIIPLSKGGSNFIENIQPLCKSCNSKKYTKIINYKEEMITIV